MRHGVADKYYPRSSDYRGVFRVPNESIHSRDESRCDDISVCIDVLVLVSWCFVHAEENIRIYWAVVYSVKKNCVLHGPAESLIFCFHEGNPVAC